MNYSIEQMRWCFSLLQCIVRL